MGKGRKERATPLTALTVHVLRGWLAANPAGQHDPLFATRAGTRISRDAPRTPSSEPPRDRPQPLPFAARQARHRPHLEAYLRDATAGKRNGRRRHRVMARSREARDRPDIRSSNSCSYADPTSGNPARSHTNQAIQKRDRHNRNVGMTVVLRDGKCGPLTHMNTYGVRGRARPRAAAVPTPIGEAGAADRSSGTDALGPSTVQTARYLVPTVGSLLVSRRRCRRVKIDRQPGEKCRRLPDST